jgi:ATP-binding protein involved in chromosome partitioning
VIVTTPSDVSLEDARKAVHMFEQVRVPLLGLVENMSYLQCPHCSERIDVFSTGGGKRTAKQMGVFFLGALPLDPEVRIGGDTGHPVATFGPEDPRAADFYELATLVRMRAREAGSGSGPTMTIAD